jgi:hypothetical protein
MKTNEQIIQSFREKFVGECPPYHDGITHESFPAKWTKKMLDIKELESFILQVRTEAYQEGQEDAFKGKVQNLKTLTITETVNVIPELQEYFRKQGRTDTINEIRKVVESKYPDIGIIAASSMSEQAKWFINGFEAFKEDIKTFLDGLDNQLKK